MKLVLASITLFLCMKLAYNQFGDAYDVVWRVVFYVPTYFMIIALLRFVYLQSNKRIRHFLAVTMLYMAALIVVNLLCLINKDWYDGWMNGLNRYGVPAFVLIFGIGFLKLQSLYEKIVNHIQRRKKP
jgi:hypothetical protein